MYCLTSIYGQINTDNFIILFLFVVFYERIVIYLKVILYDLDGLEDHDIVVFKREINVPNIDQDGIFSN